jgi:hypothetical protein
MSCLYCGGDEKLGTEHLIPRTRGGRDIPENVFQACRKCNASKNARLPSEWRNDLPPKVYALERRALKLHPPITPREKEGKQTAIRLSNSLVERIDKIAEHMSQAGHTVTRSEVIRLFVTRGVEQEEQKKR